MKKTVSVLLALCLLLLLSVPSMGVENAPANASYRMLFLTNDDNAVSTYSEAQSSSVEYFNSLSTSALSSLDLVVSSIEDIGALAPASLSTFLSGGGIFCIETSDTNAALDTLYQRMGYETTPTVSVKGATPVAAFVKLDGGSLNPGIISVGKLSFTRPNPDDVAVQALGDYSLRGNVNLNNFLSHALDSSSPRGEVATYAASGSSRQFYDYTSFDKVSGKDVGSCYITEYVYDICTYTEKASKKIISDVVSRVVVDASPEASVKYYSVRLGTSASSAYIIDQTYLQSDGTYTSSLSGGFSANSNQVISGSISASTSYSYSANGQTILNDFATNTYNNWKATPIKSQRDASWVLEPGIRVMNYNPSYYYSSAYTSLQEVAITYLGTNVFSYPLEVHGTW